MIEAEILTSEELTSVKEVRKQARHTKGAAASTKTPHGPWVDSWMNGMRDADLDIQLQTNSPDEEDEGSYRWRFINKKRPGRWQYV